MYLHFFKRFFDIVISFVALAVLSPLLIILSVCGAVFMRGNPFFIQKRPGKKDKNGNERIFSMIKFRTMSNKKENGVLLPDEKRLNAYGRFLRSASLDELPELLNVLFGYMSLVGPRPLLVKYLSLYTDEQRRRHDVRPGITGYAQIHGRNAVSFEERFLLDVYYVENVSFALDVKILFGTVKAVLCRKGINSATSATMEEFTGSAEKSAEKVEL